MPKRINQADILLRTYLDELELKWFPEYRFVDTRRWKADFYLPEHNVLLEIEGGTGYFLNPKGKTIRGGRHSRQKGYEDDCRKYNAAQLVGGFRVVRFTTGMVLSGEAKQFLSDNLVF